MLEKYVDTAGKKAIIFDMMIDIVEQAYKIDIRKKLLTRTIARYQEEKQETIVFACELFGISRQFYYRSLRSSQQKRQVAQIVTDLVKDVRLQMPRIGTRKLHHLLNEHLRMAKVGP